MCQGDEGNRASRDLWVSEKNLIKNLHFEFEFYFGSIMH